MKGFFLFVVLMVCTMTPAHAVFLELEKPLNELTAQADVVLKATALQTEPQADTKTDPWFSEIRGAGRYETHFKVVSILKGEITAEEVTFRHYTDLELGASLRGFWFALPPCYKFKSGQTYLLWADKTEDGNLRQLSKNPTLDLSQGVVRVSDDAPVQGEIKDVVWAEYIKMARSADIENVRGGLAGLRRMSGAANSYEPRRSANSKPDFSLKQFVDVAIPLLSSPDEKIAYSALASLHGEAAKLAQSQLLLIANGHANAGTRGVALQCLRGVKTPDVQDAALRALRDFPPSATNKNVSSLQSSALQLLADFPDESSRLQWRAFAMHPQGQVRNSVAGAIGIAKDGASAGLLDKMVDDSEKYVRETAVRSLLQLPVAQATPFWKKRLNSSYRPIFVNALAAQNTEPYVAELVKIVNREINLDEMSNLVANAMDYTSWHLLFDYISKKPKADLESAALLPVLGALENANWWTGAEPQSLYRFYRIQKMEERALAYRHKMEANPLNGLGNVFKSVDQELARR